MERPQVEILKFNLIKHRFVDNFLPPPSTFAFDTSTREEKQYVIYADEWSIH